MEMLIGGERGRHAALAVTGIILLMGGGGDGIPCTQTSTRGKERQGLLYDSGGAVQLLVTHATVEVLYQSAPGKQQAWLGWCGWRWGDVYVGVGGGGGRLHLQRLMLYLGGGGGGRAVWGPGIVFPAKRHGTAAGLQGLVFGSGAWFQGIAI